MGCMNKTSKKSSTTIKNVRVFDGEKLTELINVTFENGYIQM